MPTIDAFIAAKYSYGRLRVPPLGIGIHMAEGGNTVAYLANNPSRGVSVHFVVEYSGRVVQMLALDTACGALNPDDRASWDKGYFGSRYLRDVLGMWWTNPNAASIQMEIEGFALQGPNPAQVASVIDLCKYLRIGLPTLRGAFGHADQTDTKRCPGTTVAMQRIFSEIGGHGLWDGDVMQKAITSEVPVLMNVASGSKAFDLDGTTVLHTWETSFVDRYSPYAVGTMRAMYAIIKTVRRIVLVVPSSTRPLPISEPPEVVYNRAIDDAITTLTRPLNDLRKDT